MAGASNTSNGTYATLWSMTGNGTTATSLGYGVANAINNAGQVAGSNSNATVWTVTGNGTTATSLGSSANANAIIKAIRATGIATIIVDKNFGAVSAITDRNILLVKGQIVFDGTTGDLVAQPELLQRSLGI